MNSGHYVINQFALLQQNFVDWLAYPAGVYFSQCRGLGSLRSRCQQAQFQARTFFLACRQWPSCCALTKQKENYFSSSYKATNAVGGGGALMTLS
jgi:hypothetical protein